LLAIVAAGIGDLRGLIAVPDDVVAVGRARRAPALGKGPFSTASRVSSSPSRLCRRFVKRQQMHWSLRGAHLLLQTRTKVLNNELDRVFARWYPGFRAEAA
jgi:hypothetical protein